jgi:hypothetical protein
MKGMEVGRCHDQDLWDRFVASSPQGAVFCSSHFLAACDADVDYWMLERNGVAKIAMPVVHRSGEPWSPPFSYYLGPMLAPEIDDLPIHRKAGWLQSAMAELLQALAQHYDAFILEMHHTLDDVRAFDWFNYHAPESGRCKIEPRYTGLVDLTVTQSVDELLRQGRKDRRQDRRRAEEAGLVMRHSRDVDDIELLIELYAETFQRQGLETNPDDIDALVSISNAALKNGFGEFIVIEDVNAKALATQLCLMDQRSAHAVANASRSEALNSGASALACLGFVNTALREGLRWADFNGANSPDRADFKHSFGAAPALYFSIAWSRP